MTRRRTGRSPANAGSRFSFDDGLTASSPLRSRARGRGAADRNGQKSKSGSRSATSGPTSPTPTRGAGGIVLKERAKAVAYWVWTTDLVLTTLAFLLAWWMRSHIAPRSLPRSFPPSSTRCHATSVCCRWSSPSGPCSWSPARPTPRAAPSPWHRRSWQVVQVVGAGTLTLAAAGWLLRLDFVSRPFLILFADPRSPVPARREAGPPTRRPPGAPARFQLPHAADRRHQPPRGRGGADHRRSPPLGPQAGRFCRSQRRAHRGGGRSRRCSAVPTICRESSRKRSSTR